MRHLSTQEQVHEEQARQNHLQVRVSGCHRQTKGEAQERRWTRETEQEKEIVEHPFGTMKRAFNQGYLLLKGLRKVNGEVGFTMLAYNMRRAINILGTRRLISSIGAIM